MQFWALNAPITITVDDYLPVTQYYYGGRFETIYAYIGDDASIWGSVMEKAFSKFNGNYARIVGGDAVDGDYGIGGFGGIQELGNLNKPIICAVFCFEDLILF